MAWPNDISDLAIALGRVAYRQIHNSGIHLNNLRYNSFELNKLLLKFSLENKGENQKFKIKYDPFNLVEVNLYDHLIDKRWIRVHSVCPEYTNGLTEWEHEEACKRSLQEVGTIDIVALAKAKADIEKELEAATNYSNTKRIKLKNTNSAAEIYENKPKNNNYQKNIQDSKNNKTIETTDVGQMYIPSQTDTSIVIPVNTIQKKDNSKKANTKNSKKLPKPENNNEVKDNNELTKDFLNGFDVIAFGDR